MYYIHFCVNARNVKVKKKLNISSWCSKSYNPPRYEVLDGYNTSWQLKVTGYLELYDFIYVYIYAFKTGILKDLAHETWSTQASHIAALVQQKSSATHKQFTSYDGSNINHIITN